MASQAQIKARENIMNIRKKREEEESSSRFSYSENEDPITVARRNISTIRGKQLTDNTSRLDSLRKAAEERKIREEALNKYKSIARTTRNETKKIQSTGQALDERLKREMGVNSDRVGSERLERAVAVDRLKKRLDREYYNRLLTNKSQMDDKTRRKALEELKQKIATEGISGDSKTLADLSSSFSRATGRKVSKNDAYQMLENAQGQIDRDEYDQKRAEKRKELEKVLEEKGFETAAQKGSQLAEKKTVYNADLLAGYQNEDKSYPDIFKSQTEYDQYKDMTNEEKSVFHYYLASRGVQKAKEYLDTVKRDITKRQTQKDTERLEGYAEEHPALSTASSVAAGFATGMGALETIRQNAENVITGQNIPVDINSKPFRATNAQDTIRNTVMNNFQGSEDVKALKRFLYSTGTSMADFATQAAVGGLVGGFAGEAASLAGASAERAAQITATIANNSSLPLMGAGAMSQTVKEVIENGGTNDQAMQLGLIAGAAEIVTERLGIDNLSQLSSLGVNSVKRAVHKIVAEGAIPEGLEEVVSDIVNNVANDAIMQENSDFEKVVQNYMYQNDAGKTAQEQRMTRRQAEDLAMSDRIKDMALSFAGGALSGGTMAAGAYAGGYMEGGNFGRELNSYEGYSDEQLLRDGKAMTGTNSEELAKYYEGKGKLSDRQRAELFNQILQDSDGKYTPSEDPVKEQNENEPIEITEEDLHTPSEQRIEPESRENSEIGGNTQERNKTSQMDAQRSTERVNYKGVEGSLAGIDRVENGKIYARVNTEDNTIVQPVENLNFDNAITQALYQTAEGYQNAGARNFIMEYNGENLDAYKRGYDAYYDAATVGIPMKRVNSVYGNMLTERQKAYAYQAGEVDANLEKKYETLKENRTKKTPFAQVQENDAFKSLSTENQEMLKAYAKASGASIVVDETISAGNRGANGYYDNNGTIHVAADSTNPFSVVVNHELTHYLQQFSPIYDEYKNKVIDYMINRDGTELDEMIERHMSMYEDTGRTISRDEAMDEIVANASEMFLTDEKAIQKMVKENRSVGEKILDFFKDLISKLKEAMKGYEPKSKEAKILNENLETAQKAEAIWMEALQNARENREKNDSVTGAEIKKSFNLKEDVEETKNLIAVHNLSEEKLNKQLELEGFPMISIAVTKADIGHSDFGDITAVFRKETIDPKNKKNKVYSADAWTPEFPTVDYEENYEVSSRAEEKARKAIQNGMPERLARSVRYVLGDVEDALKRHGGEDGLIEAALNNEGMKAVYLDEIGKPVKKQTKEVKKEQGNEKRSQKLNEKLDIEKLYKMPTNQMLDEYGDDLFEIVFEGNEKIKEKVKNGYNWKESKLAKRKVQRSISEAYEYSKNGTGRMETVEDYEAEDNFIKNSINEDDYKKWVKETLSGIEGKKGVKNGKDIFTPSGERRSFDSTHYTYNAENIVRAMLAQTEDVKNVEGFKGIKTVRAAAAEEFRGINDIKENANRLQPIDTEEYNNKLENLQDKLYKTMGEIVGNEEDLIDHINKMDRVGNLILDAASKPTEENVKRTLNRYGWKVTDTQAKEIAEVINDVKQMPVNMFEAKPQRVVGYDEVAYWILPDSISEETRKRIEKVSQTAPILEYKEGNENQRKNIVNSLDDVKFSLKEDKKITEFADEIEDIINKKGAIPNWKKIDVGTVTDSEASAIKSVIGIETKGWKKKWSADDMAHLIERHGKNGEADKTMKNNSDIGKTNAAILGFDEVREGIGSKKYKNSDHTPAKTVLFLKNEAGDIWNVVEVVPDSQAKTVWIQTAYKKRGDASSLIQNMPQADVRNEKGLPLTTNIDDSGKKVNKNEIEGLKHSIRDTSEVDYETLKKENRELRNINKNLQDMIALEYGAKPQQDAIRKVSRHILKEYESGYDAKTLEKNLTAIWEYLANNKNPNGEELASITSGVAKGILEKSRHLDTEMRDQYKDLLTGIRNTKLKLDVSYRGDMDQVGGYSDFRKKNFGKIRLGNDGIEVDSYYQELASEYPELFNASEYTTPADQLMHIADVVQMLQPTYINPYGMNMDQAAADLAYKIYDSYYNIAKKGNALETKKIAELNRARSQFKDRQLKIREEMKQKYEETLKGLREENTALKRGESEKLLEQKAKYDSMISRRSRLREESGDRTRLLKALNRINRMRSTPENMKKAQELIGDIDLVAKSMTAQGQYNMEVLRDRYEQQKKINPDFVESKSIEEKLSRLNKEKIADMGISGVRDLLEVVLEFEHKVQTDAKQIDSEWEKTNYDLARKIESEVRASKGYNPKNVASDLVDKYNTSILSAEREFRRMAGYAKDSQLERQAKELNKGQLKKTKFQQDAAVYFRPFMETEGKWIDAATGKKANLIKIGEKNGKNIEITPAMRMSLYLHAKSEANLRHIIGGTNVTRGQLYQYQGGGIKVPDMDLYKAGKIQEAYNRGETVKLTKTGLQKILSEMTPKEKRFAEMVSGYFNGQMKEAINETSLKLDGYEKARVTNYFPINTDKNFTNKDFDTLIKDATIEGMGMLKQRSGGTNPVMLEDIFNVLNRQIENVSSYYGLAIPVRNFNKIYNSTAKGYEDSVKTAIGSKWGNRGNKYIENLLADLQGGRKSEMNWLDKMRGRYAQAVLTLNPSVTMKQAASYPTAAATLGWGPVTKALLNQGVRTDRKIIDKYSPLLWYRNQGNVTNDIADINQAKTWATKAPKPVQKYLLNWIQNADTLTVQRLWLASEYYVQDEMHVKKGTAGYYEKVAEVYNKVIEDTQPNYTVMQRPDVLRSPNQMTKALTMFSTQRLQNYGIVYDAIGEYRARLSDLKKGTGTKEDVKTAKKNLARAVSSQIVAAAVIAGMTFIAGAALHREKNWEDEAGNITTESFMKQFGKDMGSTIAGSSIGGNELFTFLTAMIEGEKWWGLETSSVSTLNDIGDDIKKTWDTISNLLTGDGTYQATKDAIQSLGMDASKIFGVPAENVKKIIDGAILWKEDVKGGTFLKASDTHYADYKKIWNLTKEGKEEEAGKIRKELEEKLGETAVNKGIQNIKISELSYREEMGKIIEARKNSDLETYKENMKKLEEEGYDRDTILKFVNSKAKTKEITYDELWEVWKNGTKEQYEDMKEKMIMNGKKEETIKNQMKKKQSEEIKNSDPDFQKAADAKDAGNDPLYESLRDELTYRYESQGYNKSRIANLIKGLRKNAESSEESEDDDMF